MSQLVVAGRMEDALTHFALVGAAAIVDSMTGEASSRGRWSDEQQARALLETAGPPEEVATLIRAHATRHTMSDSWVQVRIEKGPRAGTGLFTARAKAPELADWAPHVSTRRTAREVGRFTRLDAAMQLALGEPAWWRCGEKETRPDDGASRWEMKTRNQGQEFLVHRLAPLAEAVAGRECPEVLSGLIGETQIDELGKGSPESRTGTGLITPGPVDSVLAWCALWGLSVLPTLARSAGMSQSPGVWPRRGVHPRVAALPVFVRSVSPRRYSEIMLSKSFDLAGVRAGDADPMHVVTARSWLREQGVRALMNFAIRKTGSASAPERQILAGEVLVFD